MQPPAGDLSGAVLDGRYKVIEPVAQGAMGVVYRAERVKLGRIVAIKVLHDELPNELSSRKRFEIEAMAMARLEHPHCAAVLDVGVHDERPFVVMDFVSGQDLKVLLADGAQPIPRAVEIVRQVLSGLAHAHELGIIHRDIKPANIILSQKAGLGDHVKILDFGLARLNAEASNLTTGIVVGTPSYMAPEQIRGVAIDKRADLYAVGVLLFELLTGKKPFQSPKDDPVEVCSMHLKTPPPRLAAAHPGTDFGELEAVVARALAKNPDDRYASAEEMSAALTSAAGRAGVPAPVAEASQPNPVAYPAPIPTGAVVAASHVPSGPVAVPSGQVVAGALVPSGPVVAPSHVPSGPVAVPSGQVVAGAPVPSGPVVAGGHVPSGPIVAGAPVPSGPVVAPVSSGPVVTGAPVPSGAAVAGAPVPSGPVVNPASTLAPHLPFAPTVPSGGPALPFTRKQLAIAGGGLLAVIVIIAIAAGGRSREPAAVATDAGATRAEPEITMQADGAGDALARATELADGGRREAAIDLLVGARKTYADDARLAYLAGKLYFGKLWFSEGLKQFRDAVRLDPTYKSDPELIKTVLKAFNTTPRHDSALASFLRETIGEPAKPYLEETAQGHPNAKIRARAAEELERY